ncbi:hypothetical protein BTH42_30510 [Burkholderia sp. SRS-W-2-2016]|uniref:hypothetical protein n=1 Tax=Burkholderia sp. SRS-W-2-2016 TaxID=1926878 RepID=UPI00094B4460|nr:hypothetical protein [Burkholderia sp. SRS-W-2-2016]OLL27837.1 hypothetical protein BTH42_30510 [Burkholderia sp. SRS-W-2-2016]
MRVRAVAAALAVWCMSEAAVAAGYTETWNPPEASGHVVSGRIAKAAVSEPQAAPAQAMPGASAQAGAHIGGKAGAGAHPVRVAGGRQRPAHVATTAGGARHGDKLAAHRGGVKKIAAIEAKKGGVKGAHGGVKAPARVAAAGKGRAHATVTAQAAHSPAHAHPQAHAQLVRAKPAQGKVMRANFATTGRNAHPHAVKVSAKPAVARANPIRPAVQRAPADSANVGDIAPMGSVPNPATASSGSLPPIIH